MEGQRPKPQKGRNVKRSRIFSFGQTLAKRCTHGVQFPFKFLVTRLLDWLGNWSGHTKMAPKKLSVVAYYRTSSAANVGPDKDSQRRQAEAVESFSKGRHVVADSFYDAATSGADPLAERPGFAA